MFLAVGILDGYLIHKIIYRVTLTLDGRVWNFYPIKLTVKSILFSKSKSQWVILENRWFAMPPQFTLFANAAMWEWWQFLTYLGKYVIAISLQTTSITRHLMVNLGHRHHLHLLMRRKTVASTDESETTQYWQVNRYLVTIK